VVFRGGFHGGADTGSFVVVPVVVMLVAGVGFGGDARGGWCWFWVRINSGFCGG